MPLTVKYDVFKENKFVFPFRIFVSGSSQSGKTHLTGKILRHNLFQQNVARIMYFHPDYLEDCPVNWHETFSVPVSYHSGVPSLKDLCDIERNTCIVLDDLFEESVNSKAIDYLFRVLSGKKNLSVMILSQRYFAHGKFAMNIRNNCNFTILLRNVDSKINSRIAALMGLTKPIAKAIENVYEDNYWPYIFIDSSPRGQVTKYRVFTDIFAESQEVFSDDGMKAYVIAEKDFLKFFKVRENKLAEINADPTVCEKTARKVGRKIDSADSVGSGQFKSNQSTESENRKQRLKERLKRHRIRRRLAKNLQ